MTTSKSTGINKLDHYTDFSGRNTNGWVLVQNASIKEGHKGTYYCELVAVGKFPRLAHTGISFVLGKSYEMSVLARGTSETYGRAYLAMTVYGAAEEGNENFKVTPHWETYKFTFTMTSEDAGAGEIWIRQALVDFGDPIVDVDNIHIREL
jgi:hypothetical protein